MVSLKNTVSVSKPFDFTRIVFRVVSRALKYSFLKNVGIPLLWILRLWSSIMSSRRSPIFQAASPDGFSWGSHNQSLIKITHLLIVAVCNEPFPCGRREKSTMRNFLVPRWVRKVDRKTSTYFWRHILETTHHEYFRR